MDFLTDWLTNWLKELLIGGIMGNLEGLFDTVNTQVGEIAAQVGTTPAAWHAGVFSLIRQLSETVILPIAGMVLTFVATYELIQMLLEKNNMHEVDVANLYKWMFKTACAILILSNTFNIVMAVFDVSQSVIAQAGGLIQGSTDVSADMLAELETSLEAMDLGPLLGLWLQSALIGFTMKAMGIIIFVLVYGRMLEIYLLTSLAPIPVAMLQLVESVKERGVITPATVRQKEDGRYELVSGHRRKRACELAGFETLRCEVVDLDRDAATILMVESNYQRSQILPSEKAFAYKMRLEAMKRQAGRPSKENGVPLGHDNLFGKSRELLAAEGTDSNTQIQRYVRLTNLVPELLDLVDDGRIKMRPAVELSYLDEGCQRDVVEEIDLNQCTPSHDQTIRMRKFFSEGKLTPEVVSAIMCEEKPNQREKIILRGDKVRSLIPKNIPISQTEDYVLKALEHYSRFLRQRADRDSR